MLDSAPVAAPIDLAEAAMDAASGWYGDLDASDILLEYAIL